MTPSAPDAAGPDHLAAAREPLPDLLGLSLGELRRLNHPVLSQVLDELRDRLGTGETLWDFDQGA